MYSFLRNIYYKIFYGRSYDKQQKVDQTLRELRTAARKLTYIQTRDRRYYYNPEYRKAIAEHNRLTRKYCKLLGPLHDVCI